MRHVAMAGLFPLGRRYKMQNILMGFIFDNAKIVFITSALPTVLRVLRHEMSAA
jgi:hypothetical protein